ncbi:MAG: DUF1800 family protein [Flammeovirgaceae bacterium]
MALPPFSGTLGPKRAAHLLHRASFGPTKALIDTFANYTAPQAMAQLFSQPLPNPALPIDPETNQEWFLSGTTDANSGELDLQDFFKGWFIAQMLGQGQGLSYTVREKMVFFIHTVLTTIISKVDNSRMIYFQNQLFRQFAFDKTAVEWPSSKGCHIKTTTGRTSAEETFPLWAEALMIISPVDGSAGICSKNLRPKLTQQNFQMLTCLTHWR